MGRCRMDIKYSNGRDYRSQQRQTIYTEALFDYYIQRHPLANNPHAAHRAADQCRKACEQAMHGFPVYEKHEAVQEAQDIRQRQQRIEAALDLDRLAKQTAKCTYGIPDWAWENTDLTENDIRDLADYLDFKLKIATRNGKGTQAKQEAEILKMLSANSVPKTGITQRWMRKRMRAQIRRAQEASHLLFRDIGKGKQEYSSNWTTINRKEQLETQKLWMQFTNVINERTGEELNLSDISRTAKHKLSEALAIISAMEEVGSYRGYQMLFITVTLPSEYHPNPEFGANSWDGSSPADGMDWIKSRWAKVRALIKKKNIKNIFIRTIEPHKDAAPHMHLMVWTDNAQEICRIFRKHFQHSDSALDIKFLDYKHGDNAKAKAKATSYLLKYVIKTFSGDESTKKYSDNAIDRVDAWRSTYNIRALQFGGLPRGAITMWRETRRIQLGDDNDEIPDFLIPTVKAAKANDFQTFWEDVEIYNIKLLKEYEQYSEDLCSQEELTRFAAGGGKKVVGIKVRDWKITTRRYKWKLDFHAKDFFDVINGKTKTKKSNKNSVVTVIHNNPRGDARKGWNHAKSWKSDNNSVPPPKMGPPKGQAASWQPTN